MKRLSSRRSYAKSEISSPLPQSPSIKPPVRGFESIRSAERWQGYRAASTSPKVLLRSWNQLTAWSRFSGPNSGQGQSVKKSSA